MYNKIYRHESKGYRNAGNIKKNYIHDSVAHNIYSFQVIFVTPPHSFGAIVLHSLLLTHFHFFMTITKWIRSDFITSSFMKELSTCS